MRFVVHESSGYLTPTSHGPPGATYSVHDSWVLYRTVGLFRHEDHSGGGGGRAGMHERARAQAYRLAALLNGDYAA